MYRNHSIAVVVPAYNEAGFVGRVVETVPRWVDRIYVVDDASTDGTWAEIRACVSTDWAGTRRTETKDGDTVLASSSAVADGGTIGDSRIVAIRHAENRGVGAAITSGYRHAVADEVDVTAVMAGDGQMDPAELDRLLDPIVEGEADYAKGNRLANPAYTDGMSRFRLLGNHTLAILTKIATGYWTLHDPQNGYTAISHEALEAVDLDSRYEGYGFANDLLVALNTQELCVADVAMPAVYGEERSHITYRTFVPGLSWLLLRGFSRRLAVRYVRRDFHPVAPLYLLGSVGSLAGVAGVAGSIRKRETDTRLTAIVCCLVSWMALLAAMLVDRYENCELVVRRE